MSKSYTPITSLVNEEDYQKLRQSLIKQKKSFSKWLREQIAEAVKSS